MAWWKILLACFAAFCLGYLTCALMFIAKWPDETPGRTMRQ
jgi:hypothetical protein